MSPRVTRRRRKVMEEPAPGAERGGMWRLRAQYLEWLAVRNYSKASMAAWSYDLSRFLMWCDERGLTDPTEVTQPVVERYQTHLYYYRQPNGKPLTTGTQYHRLGSVRSFFRWTARQHLTLFNPAAEIEMPRLGRRLPRNVLNEAEVEKVLEQPDVRTPLGVRDRAILETLYSTGIRRKELAGLTVYDLDMTRGTLLVREGKGQRDRVVPIGQRAREWINRYVLEVRPRLVVEPTMTALFLSVEGNPFFDLGGLSSIARRYLDMSKVGKAGGCHIFRHTAATLMLENGADVRFIQDLLGHSKLSTTAVYTHVSIGKLQEIHRATHPAEREPSGRAPDLDVSAAQLLDELAQGDEDEDKPESADPDF